MSCDVRKTELVREKSEGGATRPTCLFVKSMSEESYDVRKTELARSVEFVSDKNEGGTNRPTCEGILAARLLENLWAL